MTTEININKTPRQLAGDDDEDDSVYIDGLNKGLATVGNYFTEKNKSDAGVLIAKSQAPLGTVSEVGDVGEYADLIKYAIAGIGVIFAIGLAIKALK